MSPLLRCALFPFTPFLLLYSQLATPSISALPPLPHCSVTPRTPQPRHPSSSRRRPSSGDDALPLAVGAPAAAPSPWPATSFTRWAAAQPPPPRSTALFPRRVVPYPWRSAPQPRRPPPGWQRPLLGDSTLAAHGGAPAKPPRPRAAASSASNEQWRRGRIRRWWHRRRPRVDPAAVAAAEGGSGRLFFSFFFLLEFIFYFFGIGHWDS